LPADLAWRAERTAAGLAVADACIAPTRSFARALSAMYGNAPRTSVVYNAVTSQLRPGSADKDCILTAGRLWDPAKNVTAINEAAALASIPIYTAGASAGPNGENPRFSNLKLLGELSEVELAKWYQRTAIFVSVSKYEPFGLSVLEAAHAGAALVLSDIPTFRELWEDAAWFVPANAPQALAKALDRLLCDSDKRSRLAACAQARAQQYDDARMLEGTLTVYRQAKRIRVARAPSQSAA
jgi:glycosyltransferase involved in cell wall biosynthesis